ncbi:MATE family efflux transporter [Capnocytophaga stomatis]|uniref:MATE family efflux transporter n=1 Tax=Capnocytophaga stomatis TaxID=1848904 RepID=UPI001AD07323|nr:MATE family efflux transporter [Capnocytophaga stomatis]GIM49332.1 MATE family efflux transporter [Capnocytophaga stomatis]
MSKVSLKEINRLAIPAIISGIIEPIISLTDTIVAGHIPTNTEEILGAVGIVGSFITAIIWIFAQTSYAIASQVAQGYGQSRLRNLKGLVSQVFWFSAGISLIGSGISFALGDSLFRLYGAEGKLLDVCLQYFNIRVWGFPLTLLTIMLYGVFKGVQNTSWAMVISVFGGILNIILNLVFVFLLDLGVKGLAWATLISQIVMFVLALIFLHQKTIFRIFIFRKLHPSFWNNLIMSFNLLIRSLSLQIALFFAFRVATNLGGESDNSFVATHTLLAQIWLFSAFFIDGYSSAGGVLSGKLYGIKKLETMTILVKDLLKITILIGFALVLVYSVFYFPIGNFFTKNEDIRNLFFSTFWIVVLMQPINSITFLLDGVYKGIGFTKTLRNVLLVATFVVFLPFLYLFQSFNWELKGIWLAFFAWIITRGLLLALHFRANFIQK